MTERIDVEFGASDGTVLRGWIYRPAAGPEKFPAITMAHGFGATKYHGLDGYARKFADAGFVVLVHDHRGFGDSDGAPRQDIDPWKQIDDWRRAISFLEALPYVDEKRIGVWGTSYSGGHAIVLGATDRRLRAVVSQVPTIDGFASGQRRIPPGKIAEIDALFIDDERAQARGELPRTQRIADADPNVPAQYHTLDTVNFFLQQKVPEGKWANELTIQSNRRARMYEPGRWIDRISPTPLLVVAVTHDTTAPSDLALAAYEKALEPKKLVLMKGGHYAPYFEGFDVSSDAAVEWFKTQL